MIKIKLKKEYDVDLLDKHTGSRRDKKADLPDDLPAWAQNEDNLWGKYFNTDLDYKRKIEVWEKLCIEAYLVGWIDYFDFINDVADNKREIYFKWEEDKKKPGLLEVYLNPSPKVFAAPPPPKDSSTSLPKPPPPHINI